MRLSRFLVGLLVLSGLILGAVTLKAEKARGLLLVITTNDTETVWHSEKVTPAGRKAFYRMIRESEKVLIY